VVCFLGVVVGGQWYLVGGVVGGRILTTVVDDRYLVVYRGQLVVGSRWLVVNANAHLCVKLVQLRLKIYSSHN